VRAEKVACGGGEAAAADGAVGADRHERGRLYPDRVARDEGEVAASAIGGGSLGRQVACDGQIAEARLEAAEAATATARPDRRPVAVHVDVPGQLDAG